MKNDIKISIITASYNYENYIRETIESVLAQTYQNWEMIIFDDGSKDNSVEVIKSYCAKDPRIKLFCHPENQNKGLQETIKEAIKVSESNWIAFLESDDLYSPFHLERKVEIIKQNPNVEFIFNDVNMFQDEERIRSYDWYREALDKVFSKIKKYPHNFLKELYKKNVVWTFSAVMLKKDLLKDIDFNSPIKPLLDYYLWLQIARNHDFYYLDEKITNWRMHKNSYISTKQDTESELKFAARKKFLTSNNILYKLPFTYEFILMETIFNFYRKKIIRIRLSHREISLLGKTWHF